MKNYFGANDVAEFYEIRPNTPPKRVWSFFGLRRAK